MWSCAPSAPATHATSSVGGWLAEWLGGSVQQLRRAKHRSNQLAFPPCFRASSRQVAGMVQEQSLPQQGGQGAPQGAAGERVSLHALHAASRGGGLKGKGCTLYIARKSGHACADPCVQQHAEHAHRKTQSTYTRQSLHPCAGVRPVDPSGCQGAGARLHRRHALFSAAQAVGARVVS